MPIFSHHRAVRGCADTGNMQLITSRPGRQSVHFLIFIAYLGQTFTTFRREKGSIDLVKMLFSTHFVNKLQINVNTRLKQRRYWGQVVLEGKKKILRRRPPPSEEEKRAEDNEDEVPGMESRRDNAFPSSGVPRETALLSIMGLQLASWWDMRLQQPGHKNDTFQVSGNQSCEMRLVDDIQRRLWVFRGSMHNVDAFEGSEWIKEIMNSFQDFTMAILLYVSSNWT